MVKTLELKTATSCFDVKYRVRNLEKVDFSALFGIELNLTLLAGDADNRYYDFGSGFKGSSKLASRGVVEDLTHFALIDTYLGLRIDVRSDEPARLWRYPVETVSLSEEGFERVYQQSCLMPAWELNLGRTDAWNNTVRISFTRLS